MQSEERRKMRFSELVETVSKKPISPWVKHLLVEVMVMDEEGEDVEVSSRPAGCFAADAWPGPVHCGEDLMEVKDSDNVITTLTVQ